MTAVRNTPEYYLNEILKSLGEGRIFSFAPSASLSDQAGRQRSSTPVALGDYKLLRNRLPNFFDTVTNGTATVDYNNERAAHRMQTFAAGDWAIVQTYQSHNYFAGKSQFIEETQFSFHDQPGIEKRYGYYRGTTVFPFQTGLDGYYLYSAADGSGHYLKIVNNGFPILDLHQSEWDDPLDGTGPSGFTINWANFNVSQVSFLWLGGTGLRLSIVVGSKIVQVHDYAHVGSVNSDKLIFRFPNRPVRMEIIQTGDTPGIFEPVCSTVISEGSDSSGNIGEVFSVDSGTANNISVSYPKRAIIKGIRLQPDAFDISIDLLSIDAFGTTTNDFFEWQLILNPQLVDDGGVAKVLPFTDKDNTPIQEATGDGATFAVGGFEIGTGYGSARGTVSGTIDSARKLGASIAGVPDELYLVISPLQGTTNLQAFGALEIRAFV
jgi:hypothetical protein